jgi:hypothetical protein
MDLVNPRWGGLLGEVRAGVAEVLGLRLNPVAGDGAVLMTGVVFLPILEECRSDEGFSGLLDRLPRPPTPHRAKRPSP